MKTNIKKSTGVTLMMLVVIIVVIIMLSGITVYNLTETIKSVRLNAFTTELKIMQAQVNSLNEKMRNNEEITVEENKYKGEEIQQIGQTIQGTLQDKANEPFNALHISEEDKSKYKYYDVNLIKNGLGIEGVKQDLLINVKDRKILSCEALEYNDKKYYNLESLPDGVYNVNHETDNEKPQFDVASKQIASEGEWEFEISNISYSGNINEWKAKYKEADESEWNTSNDLKFAVDKSGEYTIKIVNNDVESEEVQCSAEYSVMPSLLEGMQAITFDEEGNSKKVEDPNKNDWYSYEVTEDDDMSDGGTTEGGNSRWANATLNGNNYVWIPRYAYKTNERETYINENGIEVNKVDIQFIETNITNDDIEQELGERYIVPEAFTVDGKEVSGLWVGKYETSGTTENPRIIADAKTLKNLDEDQMSEAARALDTENIEVYVAGEKQKEVIEYLTRSQYGRNGTQISVDEPEQEEVAFEENANQNEPGIEEFTIEGEERETNKETSDVLTTTTGNKYGIYNMINSEGFRMYLKNK